MSQRIEREVADIIAGARRVGYVWKSLRGAVRGNIRLLDTTLGAEIDALATAVVKVPSTDQEAAQAIAEMTGAYTLHWTTPSELYTGSVVPHWTTRFSRSEAIAYARELIDGGQTEHVTLRSVEEIS